MRHGVKGKKFGRERGPRRAFMKTLAGNLIQREHILTTEARAKALRPFVERLITHGKRQNVASLRLLLQRLPKQAANKLYYDIAPRYQDRKGGYTRIRKQTKPRAHDASHMATIEFV